MRVLLRGKFRALKEVLAYEGDEPILEPKEFESPALVLTDDPLDRRAFGPPSVVVGGSSLFPFQTLPALGFSSPASSPMSCFVFRFFEGGSASWRPQALLGLPIETLANDDLGPRCEAGLVCRYVDPGLDRLGFLWTPELEAVLREMSYCGFVSFGLFLPYDGLDVRLCSLQTGIPFNGIFNVLEGVKGRTVEFFTGESSWLQESWTVNLTLSRHPWPTVPPVPVRTFIKGLNREVLKHLRLFDTVSFRDSCYSDSLLLGCASAWALQFPEAIRRATRTLRSLDIEDKTFRTDVVSVTSQSYRLVQDHLLLEG